MVMRGHIISYESNAKKEREKRLLEIQSVLPILELAYQVSKSSEDYNKIVKLKYEYNCILGGQINNLFLRMRQRCFEMGDKPDKLLARQLKGAQASRSIHSIKSKDGTLLTNPKDINARFKAFYSELYTSSNETTHSDLMVFLDSLETPKLNDTARAELDSDFTLEEIVSAIKSFPTGKAAGPDGFSSEFFAKFCDILAPLLLRMIINSKKDNVLPNTLYEANISLILKKIKMKLTRLVIGQLRFRILIGKLSLKLWLLGLTNIYPPSFTLTRPDLSLADSLFLMYVDSSIQYTLITRKLTRRRFCPWMHRLSGLTCLDHYRSLGLVRHLYHGLN